MTKILSYVFFYFGALECSKLIVFSDFFPRDFQRYGFYFLDLPFSLAPHYPSSVGDSLPKHQIYKGHTFCGHTMLQYSLSRKDWNQSAFLKFVKNDTTSSKNGQSMGVASTENHSPPLFVHANLLKYSGSCELLSLSLSRFRFSFRTTPDHETKRLTKLPHTR